MGEEMVSDSVRTRLACARLRARLDYPELDLFTKQHLRDVMMVAVAAYERNEKKPNRSDRRDAVMWWICVAVLTLSILAFALLMIVVAVKL